MFSFLKSLFGKSDKALDIAEKGTNALINGIDAAFFTDEEKFKGGMEVMKTHLEIIKSTADENSIRSITRRILAVSIIGTYLFLTTTSAFIWIFNVEWSKVIFTVANNATLGKLTLWCGIFYFGYYGVSNIISKTKEKK